MLGKKCALGVFGIFASLYLVGCGGSAPATSVAVTATATTVDGADATTITAVVTNDQGAKGVSWTVSGAGTLSGSTTTSTKFTASAATSASQTATITATSIADATKTAPVTITVPAKLTVTNSALTALNGAAGTTYAVQIQASGGIPPYKNWALASGSILPACLTLNSSTGVITFTSNAVEAACAAGSPYDPSFTFTDSGTPTPLTGTTPDYMITITPAPPLALAATVAPATATAGIAYAGSVAATAPGGVAPLTYSITAGATAFAAAGFTLNAATGAITGTPMTAGTVSFTVGLTDTFGDTAASQAYNLVVNPGVATHFVVAATTSTTITAGGTVGFTVTAKDVDGNTATGYAGTVHFTSTDSQATAGTGLPANSTLTNGVGNFTATLKTAGTQIITATDTSSSSIKGALSGIVVAGGAASKLGISPATTTPTAGTAFNVTVTAQDPYGNTATSTDTVSLAGAGPSSATYGPSSHALSAGSYTFSVTLTAAGGWTLTATDTTSGSVTAATTGTLTLGAAAASKLVISPATTSPIAGTPFNVTVTAQDQYGNTATGTGNADMIRLTGSGPVSFTAINQALSSGVTTYAVTLDNAGSWTLTGTDTTNGSVTAATTNTLTVSAAAAYKLVANPATTTPTAGTPFNVTVTEEDQFGNTISSTDAVKLVGSGPGSSTYGPTTQNLASGTTTFSVTLTAAEGWTLVAHDNTNSVVLNAGTGTITVGAAAASQLVINPATTTPTAGTPFNVIVTAQDQYGNTATGTGNADMIKLTGAGPASFTALNQNLVNGTTTFSVTLTAAGSWTLTGTDTTNGSVTAATTNMLTVSAAAASTLIVTSSVSSETAGTQFTVTVTAKDAYGNTATGYAGVVHFTSTDTSNSIVLPANYQFVPGTDNGVHVFNNGVTLVTAGSKAVIATDLSSSAITGTTGAINVSAAAAFHLVVAAPSAATTGVAFSVTVTAQDQYNNTATGYTGTVHFTSTPTTGTVVLPANYTFQAGDAGVHVFSNPNGVTLTPSGSTGNYTITATDMATGSITGTSQSINVSTALIIATSSLLPLDVNQSPSQILTASGGSGITADYSWSWTAQNGSSLPPGLSLNATSGAITGNPTTANIYNVVVKVTDSGTAPPNNFKTANLSIQIYPALSLPTVTLPTGYTGVVYNYGNAATITGMGGSPSTSISVTAGLPASGLSASPNAEILSITGTPTGSSAVPFTVKLSDGLTNNSITLGYSVPVTSPPFPALGSSLVGGSATVGIAYTGSLPEQNGIGPNYSWTINGSPLASGASVSIGDNLSVSYSSSNSGTLNVTGTPGSINNSPGVQFTAVVTDLVSGNPSSTDNLTIAVNPNGSTVSGQFFLNNTCGVVSTLPVVTMTISQGATIIATPTTDPSTGQYSFNGLANGTYTITPSISGTVVSSAFYPANYSVALDSSTNNNVSGQNFTGNITYTVSGQVSYTGGVQSGQVYVTLNNNNCGGSPLGTSITNATLTSGGAFTIRGVTPGSYTLSAWMDPLGQGAQNAVDPTGSNTSVTVNGSVAVNGIVTGQNVAIGDPTFVAPTANFAIQSVIPTPQGFMVAYQAPTNSSNNGNGPENATEYILQWATDPTLTGGTGSGAAQFATVVGSHTFAAAGTNSNIWIVNPTSTGFTFAANTPYYFQARAVNNAHNLGLHQSGWCDYEAGTGCSTGASTTYTGTPIGAQSCTTNCTIVSGTVTIPSGTTINSGAPLYVGIYQNSASGNAPSNIWAEEILPQSVAAAGSPNNYSITVPNNSDPNLGYVLFAILDQNNDGMIDFPDVTNARHNNSLGFTATTSTLTENLTLPAANSSASMSTDYQSSTCCSGGGGNGPTTYTDYQLNFEVDAGNKWPVAVTLASGPNLAEPVDLGLCNGCGDGSNYQFQANLPGSAPTLTDTYTFDVTYSDTSTGTVTTTVTPFGGTIANGGTGAVVGPNDLPGGGSSGVLSPGPTSTGTTTQPTFTWTWPTAGLTSNTYYYQFQLGPSSCNGSCNDVWDIPNNSGNSNGFTYAQDLLNASGGTASLGQLLWNVDPSASNSSPSGSLTPGDSYNWSIKVQDSNNNKAQSSTFFTSN